MCCASASRHTRAKPCQLPLPPASRARSIREAAALTWRLPECCARAHREVPWAAFQGAGIITREQLELIYSMDDQPVARQVELFHEKGTNAVMLFVDILTGVNKDDVICYALAMLGNILDADANVANYFTQLLVSTNGARRSVRGAQRGPLQASHMAI